MQTEMTYKLYWALFYVPISMIKLIIRNPVEEISPDKFIGTYFLNWETLKNSTFSICIYMCMHTFLCTYWLITVTIWYMYIKLKYLQREQVPFLSLFHSYCFNFIKTRSGLSCSKYWECCLIMIITTIQIVVYARKILY